MINGKSKKLNLYALLCLGKKYIHGEQEGMSKRNEGK